MKMLLKSINNNKKSIVLNFDDIKKTDYCKGKYGY
jgi:hypothetical protein